MSIGRSTLSVMEAQRAIYVDFEGNRDAPPTLLGILCETEVTQWIVEPRFRSCAEGWRAPAAAADLPDLVRDIVGQAEREGRVVVSWSEHDFHLLAGTLEGCRREALEHVYRNAIFTASRWRRLFGELDSGCANTLQAYAAALAWSTPRDIGPGTVGPAITRIRNRLESHGGSYGALTRAMRRDWRNVLRHNRHDLRQTAAVMQRCAGDLWGWLGRAEAAA